MMISWHGNDICITGLLWGEVIARWWIPLTKGQQYRALSYYSDLTLSQEFQPMAAQLSMKAALPLAKILVTASCCSSKTGSRTLMFSLLNWTNWWFETPWHSRDITLTKFYRIVSPHPNFNLIYSHNLQSILNFILQITSPKKVL